MTIQILYSDLSINDLSNAYGDSLDICIKAHLSTKSEDVYQSFPIHLSPSSHSFSLSIPLNTSYLTSVIDTNQLYLDFYKRGCMGRVYSTSITLGFSYNI